MTVLADFAQILGNQGQLVGQVQGDATIALPSFNTGGRLSNEPALLVFLASDLLGSAAIFINNQQVGAVFPTGAVVSTSTQMASFPGTVLNSGQNTISLKFVTDPFRLRNVCCFYHQDSD
jgi:hypothetical protein